MLCAARCCATSSKAPSVRQLSPFRRGGRHLKRQPLPRVHEVPCPSPFSFFYFPTVFLAAPSSSVQVQRRTTRLWVYVEGRFLSCVCPPRWCEAGRCRRSKLGCVICSGRFFFPQGAFMLCNVWDVLPPLQSQDYKFSLRRERQINTHTRTT